MVISMMLRSSMPAFEKVYTQGLDAHILLKKLRNLIADKHTQNLNATSAYSQLGTSTTIPWKAIYDLPNCFDHLLVNRVSPGSIWSIYVCHVRLWICLKFNFFNNRGRHTLTSFIGTSKEQRIGASKHN